MTTAGGPPAGGPSRRVGREPARGGGTGYLAASERPWAALVFVLPMVLAYEAYASGWAGRPAAGNGGSPPPAAVGHAARPNIIAFALLEEMFALRGAAGRHLPAVTLAAMLLAAHVVRKDSWRIDVPTLLGMAAESVVWAAPLIVLGWTAVRFLPLGSGPGSAERWPAVTAQCVGAGVYEEMVFRLIGVTLLTFIFKDLLGLPGRPALGLVLFSSGILFSLYHYLSPDEHFRVETFLFRTIAGSYFGLLFILRGFGVTAGAHSAYDLVVVAVLSR